MEYSRGKKNPSFCFPLPAIILSSFPATHHKRENHPPRLREQAENLNIYFGNNGDHVRHSQKTRLLNHVSIHTEIFTPENIKFCIIDNQCSLLGRYIYPVLSKTVAIPVFLHHWIYTSVQRKIEWSNPQKQLVLLQMHSLNTVNALPSKKPSSAH